MGHTAAKWVEAYNDHDVEALLELYHAEVRNVQFPWPNPVLGREAMRSAMQRTFSAFPDIHLGIERLTEQDNRIVIEWVFCGTMLGDFAGHAPTGRSFTMHGCEVLELRAGLIFTQHGYWDKQSMFSQLGI